MSQVFSDYPFESHYLNIDGANLHYLDEGQGDPILFLHGVPTWSYLWRKIIPHTSQYARCIAPDLMGFGLSDKPDIDYSIEEHTHYISQLIEHLQLDNITLVMHGWGSVVGFHYAMQHPEKIKGLAFIEAHVRANMDWAMLSLPVQQLAELMLDEPDQGYDLIMQSDYYLDYVFRPGILRNLSDDEWHAYSKPFLATGSKKPIWRYFQDLPLRVPNEEVTALIDDYSEKLCQSTLPKLMLYAVPGFITTMDTVSWAKEHMSDLSLVDIGDALHYPQESNPELIAEELQKWYQNLAS